MTDLEQQAYKLFPPIFSYPTDDLEINRRNAALRKLFIELRTESETFRKALIQIRRAAHILTESNLNTIRPFIEQQTEVLDKN